ncbi:PilZ domain-containing protein [Roseomonas sp. HJA6]|uniref:PilZ domain-containing protein n=1 Tax=Roseomonas alba TaxID=2846776 RepID=A0ABS7AEG1_9PROT|nr:PilZ domain-containing protein [Neoroseomonas alba]MBW6400696.1 PilZ domain-containing protein [Neoroseomonas alba]
MPARTKVSDRRAHDRVPLRRAAMLELAGRRTAVNLLDLSEGGAAVQVEGLAAAPGTPAALMLDTALLPARVVAAEDGCFHLAFQTLSPGAAAVVNRLLAPDAGRALAA